MAHQSDTGVVPLKAAQAMQQDSVASDDREVTPQPPKEPPKAVPEKKPLSTEGLFDNTFSACVVNVMFTFGLSDQRFVGGTAKPLAHWSSGELEYNLYNPFRKGGKSKISEEVVVPGIVRPSLEACLNAVGIINNSRILFLGKPREVFPALTSAIGRVADVCRESLGIKPDLIIGDFAEDVDEASAEGEDEVVQSEAPDSHLRFSDIVRVTSWLSMDWRDEAALENPVMGHEAMVHFFINSGALYDSSDRLKMIRQLESTIRLTSAKAGDPTSMLFALNLSSEDLVSAEMRDLLGVLLESEGFEMFTRHSMLENFGQYDFMPKSKKGVQEELLNPQSPAGDLFLVKILSPKE